MSAARIEGLFAGRPCRRCRRANDPAAARAVVACAVGYDVEALAEASSALNFAGARAERAGDFAESDALRARGRRLRDVVERLAATS